MTENQKPQALSNVVRPGIDYPMKVKIGEVVGKQALITRIERTEGSKEFALTDPDTGEIVIRDYWNIEIELDGLTMTFSTGAMPIDKVLTALQAKIDSGEAHYPFLATFRKDGRTYTVS